MDNINLVYDVARHQALIADFSKCDHGEGYCKEKFDRDVAQSSLGRTCSIFVLGTKQASLRISFPDI